MSEIKPIETVYNGYRFRSRLEARWAVFFDAIGIRYEYEPEGFEIEFADCTIRYLPDFYLPDHNVYVEVKGSDEQLKRDAEKIGCAVDFQATPISMAGLVILGPIPYKPGSIPYFDFLYWDEGVCSTKCLFDIDGDFQCGCRYDNASGHYRASEYWDIYQIDDYNCDCATMTLPESVSVNAKYQDGYETCLVMKNPFWQLNEAYAKARQARFEYGETPRHSAQTQFA